MRTIVTALLAGTLLTSSASAATFTVTTADDAGAANSLRTAIESANTTPGLDTIVFAIGGTGPYIIAVSAPLPVITDPVLIDGSTQPGVIIDGNGDDPSHAGWSGLVIGPGGAGSTIR